jgi:hypothetical protein
MQKIDSLKEEIKHSPVENRYSLLSDLAWEFRFAYPDSTISYDLA